MAAARRRQTTRAPLELATSPIRREARTTGRWRAGLLRAPPRRALTRRAHGPIQAALSRLRTAHRFAGIDRRHLPGAVALRPNAFPPARHGRRRDSLQPATVR